MDFVPIKLEKYLDKHMASNPNDKRADVKEALLKAVRAKQAGVRCRCGNPIWAIGSAMVGNACFTCITGEATPDSDYEIDKVCT